MTDSRNHTLDGLRALAALSVLIFHVWLYQIDGPIRRSGFSDSLLFEFRVGFLFFFLLSGFLVFTPFCRAALGRSRPVANGNYIVRRAARIVPAYYAAIVGAYLLIETAGDAPGRRYVDLDQLPIFFLFLQNYFPETLLRLNAPTWTLVVEVAFYLLLPLLAVTVLRRRGARAQLVVIVAFLVSGLTWNLITHLEDWGPVATHTPFPFLPYFAFGMFVAVAAQAEWFSPGRRASVALALLGVALIVANGYWHATDRAQGMLIETLRDLPAAIGMTMILAATVLGTGAGMGWLGGRALVWLGAISYGLFLWHVPLIVWLNGHDLLPGGVLAGVAIVLPVAIAAGAASWYLLERRFVSRAAGRPRTAPERPAAT